MLYYAWYVCTYLHLRIIIASIEDSLHVLFFFVEYYCSYSTFIAGMVRSVCTALAR